jgi:ubiquinone/menaquinone biosynthesis C-methylase UbiE
MDQVILSSGCGRLRGGLVFVVVVFGSLFLPLVAQTQQVAGGTNRYDFHQPHNPDGIGKFYMGREIAQVMGHESAAWLERNQRIAEEQPDQLVSLLNLRRGEIVADIGAGTGYFSRRLAQAVGPAGRVLAEDVQPEMLILLTNLTARLGLTNVTPVLGTVTAPRLPAASVDLALMVDVYHEFDFPYEMMQGICLALKPGGLVVLVEYRGEDPNVPIKPLHKMTQVQVKREMSVLPLDWVQTIERLPRQHIIAFRKRSVGMPVASAPAPFREK